MKILVTEANHKRLAFLMSWPHLETYPAKIQYCRDIMNSRYHSHFGVDVPDYPDTHPIWMAYYTFFFRPKIELDVVNLPALSIPEKSMLLEERARNGWDLVTTLLQPDGTQEFYFRRHNS